MTSVNRDTPELAGDLVSPRSMAELARAGFSMVRQRKMRVPYQVHHVADHPGYLDKLIGSEPSAGFIETLTTAAHGTGLVIVTQAVATGAGARAPIGAGDPVHVQQVPGVARRFSGNAVPNVSFVYDSANVFEGLIAIGRRDVPLQRRHARAILDIMAKIAELAVGTARAPILSLQSPVQLPLRASSDLAADREDRDETPQDTRLSSWPSDVIAVRFSIGLATSTAKLRLRLAKEAARFCEDNGFAFWVADTRSGFRAGSWFPICRHDVKRLRAYFERSPEKGDGEQPQWSVPLTFVGPARVGAIKSIVSYLRCYPPVGVIACSMSIINDVAFIHLQLTTSAIQTAVLEAVNKGLDQETTVPGNDLQLAQVKPVTLLPVVLAGLVGGGFDPRPDIVANLTRKVGDFHLLVGPARRLPLICDQRRWALWVSWEMAGQKADLSVPFLALYDVLRNLMPNSIGGRESPEGPNVEYLICRRVRYAVLRGKGKISFPNSIQSLVARDDIQAGLAALCEQIEDGWRAKLDPTYQVRELTVSWRETWLGHWVAPVD